MPNPEADRISQSIGELHRLNRGLAFLGNIKSEESWVDSLGEMGQNEAFTTQH